MSTDTLLDVRGVLPRLETNDENLKTPRIALSRELMVRFYSGDHLVEYHDLDGVTMGALHLWQQAAKNLITRCRSGDTIPVLLRPASSIVGSAVSGFQIATGALPPTAWVAHPDTFTLLDQHLEENLGAQAVYAAPQSDILVALHPGQPLNPIWSWLRQHNNPLAFTPFRCVHGFPHPVN